MRTSIRRSMMAALCGATFLSNLSWADTLITLDRPEPYELQAIGFTLERRAEIRIEALGLDTRRDRDFVLNLWDRADREDQLDVYAWIIDAESREAVWVMRHAATDRASSALRSLDKQLALEPGRYEAYLFSGLTWLADARAAARGDTRPEDYDDPWWERLLTEQGRGIEEIERDLIACHLTLTAQDLSRSDVSPFKVTPVLRGSLIHHGQLGDLELRVEGFELDRPQQLRIRALFETDSENDSEAVDYGWILEAQTRKVIWQVEPRKSQHGGGGRNNRRIDVEQTFEPGRYLLYYATNESHSFDEFSFSPPYDPLSWGIALFPGRDFDPRSFRTFTPVNAPVLIDLTRAGDNAELRQGFRLHTGGQLYLLALGEYVHGEFLDRAWITDARGKTVWKMRRQNTRRAGGAAKNRTFDGIVSLKAGEYVLRYKSDDSHSYEEFNEARPFQPQNWGVLVRPGPGFEAQNLELIHLRNKGDIPL